METFLSNSSQETQAFAATLAQQILARPLSIKAVVLGLEGDLGAGKTTFLQGFAKALGIEEVVNSPTFVIMKKFAIPQNVKLYKSQYKHFYHLDCYRLENPEEILELGFAEIIANPENIVAIEWPEKIAKLLPKEMVTVTFIHKNSTQRELNIGGLGL